ncbi:MAG TPA: SRPBCC family protein, partial [Mycobacterium sp.]|uniref:SRPBCC family protein n=1 Tax=Mycobacterium sp. TaxID=1785 RepID=UPI002CB20DE9
GAALIGHEGDEYLGKVKIKVGPVTSEFSGKVRFVEQDRDQHRAVIDGKGKEARGTGNAAATVTAQLHEDAGRTNVSVDTDLKIVGKLAQFGSAMLQQVSEKLLGQFVESLEAKLTAENAGSTQGSTDGAEGASAEESIPAWPANPVPGTRQDAAPEPEPIDLLQLAGSGQLMKYGSAAVALLAGLVLIWVLRRRG